MVVLLCIVVVWVIICIGCSCAATSNAILCFQREIQIFFIYVGEREKLLLLRETDRKTEKGIIRKYNPQYAFFDIHKYCELVA